MSSVRSDLIVNREKSAWVLSHVASRSHNFFASNSAQSVTLCRNRAGIARFPVVGRLVYYRPAAARSALSDESTERSWQAFFSAFKLICSCLFILLTVRSLDQPTYWRALSVIAICSFTRLQCWSRSVKVLVVDVVAAIIANTVTVSTFVVVVDVVPWACLAAPAEQEQQQLLKLFSFSIFFSAQPVVLMEILRTPLLYTGLLPFRFSLRIAAVSNFIIGSAGQSQMNSCR